MNKKFLLILKFISPLCVTSTVNVNAMENPRKACLQTCENAWEAEKDACKTKFPADKAQYRGCIISIGNKKTLCDEKC